MKSAATQMTLDPKRKSSRARELEESLRAKIVGQDEAIKAISSVYQIFLAGMNPPSRPVGNLLFLGPTGSGKTRVVEATAETLLGDSRALIKIDCAEFQHSHEIAKLIGSPPGYLGHRETHPVLTQEALNQWHRDDLKLSLLLLDEIEKASDSLWQLLLGILDKATLTLGDNRKVDFSQTIIFMTSNLGATEMTNMLLGGIGFGQQVPEPDERLERKVQNTALEAARRKFSPEFINRIDKTVVFRNLNQANLERVLDIELARVQQRLLDSTGGKRFFFSCAPEAKQFLLADGMDRKYGARHLKRSIERHLVDPLAHLMATDQIGVGDSLLVRAQPGGNELAFVKEARIDRVLPWTPKARPARARNGSVSRITRARNRSVEVSVPRTGSH